MTKSPWKIFSNHIYFSGYERSLTISFRNLFIKKNYIKKNIQSRAFLGCTLVHPTLKKHEELYTFEFWNEFLQQLIFFNWKKYSRDIYSIFCCFKNLKHLEVMALKRSLGFDKSSRKKINLTLFHWHKMTTPQEKDVRGQNVFNLSGTSHQINKSLIFSKWHIKRTCNENYKKCWKRQNIVATDLIQTLCIAILKASSHRRKISGLSLFLLSK